MSALLSETSTARRHWPKYSEAELQAFAVQNSHWRPASGLPRGRWWVTCDYRFGFAMPGGQIVFALEDRRGRLRTFSNFDAAKRAADRLNALCAFVPEKESDHGEK
jgi:hypothetical protein